MKLGRVYSLQVLEDAYENRNYVNYRVQVFVDDNLEYEKTLVLSRAKIGEVITKWVGSIPYIWPIVKFEYKDLYALYRMYAFEIKCGDHVISRTWLLNFAVNKVEIPELDISYLPGINGKFTLLTQIVDLDLIRDFNTCVIEETWFGKNIVKPIEIPVITKTLNISAGEDYVTTKTLKPGKLIVEVIACEDSSCCSVVNVTRISVMSNQEIRLSLGLFRKYVKGNVSEVHVKIVHEQICLNELCVKSQKEVIVMINH